MHLLAEVNIVNQLSMHRWCATYLSVLDVGACYSLPTDNAPVNYATSTLNDKQCLVYRIRKYL